MFSVCMYHVFNQIEVSQYVCVHIYLYILIYFLYSNTVGVVCVCERLFLLVSLICTCSSVSRTGCLNSLQNKLFIKVIRLTSTLSYCREVMFFVCFWGGVYISGPFGCIPIVRSEFLSLLSVASYTLMRSKSRWNQAVGGCAPYYFHIPAVCKSWKIKESEDPAFRLLRYSLLPQSSLPLYRLHHVSYVFTWLTGISLLRFSPCLYRNTTWMCGL